MGFFIVRPEHRGRGLGNILWQARRQRLLARLKPGATAGLDGVFAMLRTITPPVAFVFSHRNLRFRASIPGQGLTPPQDGAAKRQEIVPLAQVPLPNCSIMIAVAFRLPGQPLCGPGLRNPMRSALACLRAGQLAGYGVVRRMPRWLQDRPAVCRRHRRDPARSMGSWRPPPLAVRCFWMPLKTIRLRCSSFRNSGCRRFLVAHACIWGRHPRCAMSASSA
jgi:hypothetical protein